MKKVKQKQVDTQTEATVSETDILKTQLARALADYDNLQKRVEREREEGKYLSKLVVISRLLPVFDMFTDAARHLSDPGLAIALKVLTDTLKEEGIEEIVTAEGDEFSHELHEGLDTVVNAEKTPGTIAEVVLKGYRFAQGPVIRHTKVKVYKTE